MKISGFITTLLLILAVTPGLGQEAPPRPSVPETLRRLKSIAPNSKEQDRLEVERILRSLARRQSQIAVGGNISGGGEGVTSFTGSSADRENIQSFQRALLGVSEAHQAGLQGQGVNIALIDSGIDPQAPVARAVSLFKDFTSSCKRESTCDDSGHGTLVADLAIQAAPAARLIVLKALSQGASGEFAHLRSALEWVLENHRRLNIRIVNLSLLSPERISGYWNEVDEGRELVKQLDAQGVLVVAAVGNDYQKRVRNFPASSPHVIAVGSFFHNFSEKGENWVLSEFSNMGYADNPKVEHYRFLGFESTKRDFNSWIFKPEVVAPGEQVVACAQQCYWVNGSSFAAALVVGALATRLNQEPAATRENLVSGYKASSCRPQICVSHF